ncbi:MAG: hypothetical protein AAFO94_15965 [Bacteroidota bacterium]
MRLLFFLLLFSLSANVHQSVGQTKIAVVDYEAVRAESLVMRELAELIDSYCNAQSQLLENQANAILKDFLSINYCAGPIYFSKANRHFTEWQASIENRRDSFPQIKIELLQDATESFEKQILSVQLDSFFDSKTVLFDRTQLLYLDSRYDFTESYLLYLDELPASRQWLEMWKDKLALHFFLSIRRYYYNRFW